VTLEGLLARLPGDADPVVAAGAGSEAHPPACHVVRLGAPPGGGRDPHDGQGPLDQLALARARGATHFVLPAALAGWTQRYPDLGEHLARHAAVVATDASGTAWSLAPPPEPGPSKLFVIGLNKTGTTSLHLALEQLGLRSYHWGGRRAYHAVLDAQREGERLLHGVGEQYDAYGDIGPLAARFDLADLQYPGSRFILTVRDLDDWLDSRERHAGRNVRDRRHGLYGGSNVQIDRDQWRAQWDAHLARVEAWFGGRDDLLTIDVCGGEGWERLAPFLDRPVPREPFPLDNVDGGKGRWGPKRAWRFVRRALPVPVADRIRDAVRRVGPRGQRDGERRAAATQPGDTRS
jgi:hypothetical protein